MRFFFYGTLLDRDVTALVLGRRLPPAAWTPATLPGHARHRAKGVSYPVLQRDPRGEAPGAVVGRLSKRDVARLSAYEGPRYRIIFRNVRVGDSLSRAAVFEPIEGGFEPVGGAGGASWDLAHWQRQFKRAFIQRIRPVFSAHPAYSAR
jgi:hypothetical protein